MNPAATVDRAASSAVDVLVDGRVPLLRSKPAPVPPAAVAVAATALTAGMAYRLVFGEALDWLLIGAALAIGIPVCLWAGRDARRRTVRRATSVDACRVVTVAGEATPEGVTW